MMLYSLNMSMAADVLVSTVSDFYRTKVWDNPTSVATDDALPPLTRTLYAQTPFLTRLYRTHGLLTKVAYERGRPFLIGRHLDDIAGDSYGATGDRPLVALSNIHECLEKSLWCYTQNLLPLIADSNQDITAMLAKRYEADTLITDSATLTALLPALAHYYELARFRSISVVDTAFNFPFLEKMFPSSSLSLILGLPETGSIALSCPTAIKEKRIVFHAATHRRLERRSDLTVTDDRLLPTPLIRYQPGITVRFLGPCICGANESFELVETA